MDPAGPLLAVRGLHAGTRGSEILHGIDLEIAPGEVHALMGPNGSGKSTLGHVLAGRPGYDVYSGSVLFGGEDLLSLPLHERARRGLFLAFQYPAEIPGVMFETFLEQAAASRGLASTSVAGSGLVGAAKRLGIDHALGRAVNRGLSGGEMKRNETLQLSLLGAEVAILDEIDSGLDVDGIRKVAAEVQRLVEERALAVLLITHYVRILRYIPAQFTHVLLDGRIVRSGGPELADELERTGYEEIRRQAGLEVAGDVQAGESVGESAGETDIFSL